MGGSLHRSSGASLLFDFLRAFFGAVFELLSLLLARLFGRVHRFLADLFGLLDRLLADFFGAFDRLLGDLGGHLAAAVDGLAGGFGRGFLHLVGDRPDPFVLDPRARQQHADEEAGGKAADRQAERVLLGHTDDFAGALFDLLAVWSRFADFVRRPLDLLDQAVAFVGERLLHSGFDVGLVGERVDGVAHFGARLLYLLADLAWLLAHCMSSFTVSTVCSGAGGVACFTRSLPVIAITAAMAP